MIVSKTPLRVSLFGGGTDFHNYFHNSKYGYGSVISTAVNMYVYVIVNRRFDNKIRLVYWDNELVDRVDEVEHNIIREALRITNVSEGVEIVYLADLPMTNLGVGLASSSALAVGVLNALHAYKGEEVSKEQLAKEAIDIELNRLAQRIGIQDQYAVSYGGFNRYIFNKDDTVDIKPVKMPKELKQRLINNLMLFYTGNARDSRQIFKEQNKTIVDHAEILDSLVDATNIASEAIKNGDLDKLGYLLDETWQTKKKMASGISNDNINKMYDLATKAGALGGKILGAGGGGFLLLYVLPEKQAKVRKALSDYKEVKLDFECNGSTIVYKD